MSESVRWTLSKVYDARGNAQGYRGVVELPTTWGQVARSAMHAQAPHAIPPVPRAVKARDHRAAAKTPVAVKATHPTKEGALAKAADIASSIANNPIVSAVLPPGSGLAVKAVSGLAKAAASGHLEDVATKLIGPGAKRLASALASIF